MSRFAGGNKVTERESRHNQVPVRCATFAKWSPVVKMSPGNMTRYQEIADVVASIAASVALVVIPLFLGGASVYVLAALLLTWYSRRLMANPGLTPRELDEMMDLPPIVAQYPVSVKLSYLEGSGWSAGRKSAELGTDIGLISFVDGVMYFRGRETAFALVNQNIDSKLPGYSADGEYGVNEFGMGAATFRRFGLAWQARGVRGGIDIQLYEISQHLSGDLATLFRRDYLSWRTHTGSQHLEAMYPPIGPHPCKLERLNRRINRLNSLTLGVLTSSIAAGFIAKTMGHIDPALCIVFAAGLASVLLSRASAELKLLKRAQTLERRFWDSQSLAELDATIGKGYL